MLNSAPAVNLTACAIRPYFVRWANPVLGSSLYFRHANRFLGVFKTQLSPVLVKGLQGEEVSVVESFSPVGRETEPDF
jgi:hypothetical protein